MKHEQELHDYKQNTKHESVIHMVFKSKLSHQTQ